MSQWLGTEANERLIHSVRNALVDVYLNGVVGVSRPVVGYEWKQIALADSKRFMDKGILVLHRLESQKAPTVSSRAWLSHHTSEFRRLLQKASDVMDGNPQHMKLSDYHKHDNYLGVRRR